MSDVNFEYKTVCAGRYELDIPKNFEIKIKNVWINKFTVQSLGEMSEGNFQKIVADRKSAYEAGLDVDGTTRFLLNFQERPNLKIIGTQSFRKNSTAKRRLYNIEAYTRRDDVVFRLDGFIKYKSEADDLRRLEQTAAAVRVGPGDGFCFDGGHFPNLQNYEFVSAFIYDPIYDPKIRRFGVEFSASDEQQSEKDRQKPGGVSPRIRPAEIDGVSGYEFRIVTGAPEDLRTVGIRFHADVGDNAKTGEPARSISLRLFKDVYEDEASITTTSYGPSEAAAIWEKLIETIHRR